MTLATALDRDQTSLQLANCIGQTLIVAYKEDTHQLESVLNQSGCTCEVLRQVHQPEYHSYARSFLCLLNHRQAWERAASSDSPTLIVEADFSPVKNFGSLPPPFDPADTDWGIAWLYTCAPQIYNVTTTGYAVGYSTAMVAYVVNAHSARLLIERADAIAQTIGPMAYDPWDSGLEKYLRDRNLKSYVPFRNYGEHGGIPNPEHRQNKLSPTHRADVLYGALAFAPLYAQQPDGRIQTGEWLKGRLYGRIKGLGRLFLGKYLRPPVLKGSSQPLSLLGFALRRHLTWRI